MLPLSDFTAAEPPLSSLISHSFKLPSLGPRHPADFFFPDTRYLFSEPSFPHDSVALFSFLCHPFSALFLCSQQALTHHAIERDFKEDCFARLLERSSRFLPFMPVLPYEMKGYRAAFVDGLHNINS